MPIKLPDDNTFAEEFSVIGPKGMARKYEVALNNVYMHRRRVEERTGRPIHAPATLANGYNPIDAGERLALRIQNGTVLVGSDCHYWRGIISTSHRGFVKACKLLKPSAVIMNGDILDGSSISRWPAGSFQEYGHRMSVKEELDVCRERLGEILEALPDDCHKIWTLGNHDARFESRLASVAPEYSEVPGFTLKEHFSEWQHAWSCWINDDVIVKHRGKGGVHAVRNNVVNAISGKTVVTGHLHSLKVTPVTGYPDTADGFPLTVYGVDTGTMAPTYGPQFQNYIEDGVRDWREGWVVLTFVDGRLLWPEVAHVIEHGKMQFRGRIWDVES